MTLESQQDKLREPLAKSDQEKIDLLAGFLLDKYFEDLQNRIVKKGQPHHE